MIGAVCGVIASVVALIALAVSWIALDSAAQWRVLYICLTEDYRTYRQSLSDHMAEVLAAVELGDVERTVKALRRTTDAAKAKVNRAT